MSDKDKKELQIRNSTVDFLVFTKDAKEDGIEVRVQNGDVWLTQKAIGQLFDVDRSVVTKHLKNIYSSGELDEDRTCANFAQVADNGKTYRYKFYSLSAIIAVGYRINSGRATQFRQNSLATPRASLKNSGSSSNSLTASYCGFPIVASPMNVQYSFMSFRANIVIGSKHFAKVRVSRIQDYVEPQNLSQLVLNRIRSKGGFNCVG